MLNSLQEHFDGIATWTIPEGGLFIWVTLPEHINATQVLKDAIANQVVYIPGGAFAVHGGYENTIRLNFSKVPPEQIQEGSARLRAVLQSYL
jgi:2-aminoadipate transaminase